MVPTSDVLHCHRVNGVVRETFYEGVQVPHALHTPATIATAATAATAAATTILHTIGVGDLCAVRCDAGFFTPPFSTKWKVAQILTLSMQSSRNSNINSNDSNNDKFTAVVRWMAHGKTEVSLLLPSQSMKRIKDNYRIDQMLLETDDLQRVALADILPAAICIRSSRDFGVKNLIPAEPLLVSGRAAVLAWTVHFHCPWRLDCAGVETRVQDDWLNYHEQKQQQQRTGSVGTPPLALRRGWQDLCQRAELLGAFPTWTTQDLSQLSEALLQGFGRGGGGGSEEEPARFELVGGGLDNASNAAASSNEDDDDDKVDKENARNVHSKRRKPKSQPATAKKPASSRTSGAKKGRSKRSAPAKTATQSKRSRPETTQQSNKSRRVSTGELDMSVAYQTHAIPVSSALYVKKLSKQKKNGPQLPKSPHFVQGVELNLDESYCCKQKGRRKTIPSRWTVQVGDLIAVGCSDAQAPLHVPVKGESIWFPFTVPWSPAQVTAVYRQDGEYYMEYRWFYRPVDLDEETLENMCSDIQEDLFQNTKFPGRMIVEMDEDVNLSPMCAALGRIVATSKPNPSSPWLKAFRGDDGVPQMPLICKYFGQVNNAHVSLQRIEDWTEYGQSKASQGPVGRAIFCAKSLLAKDKKLCKFYEHFICDRYGLNGEVRAVFIDSPPPSPERKVVVSWSSNLLDSALVRVTDNVKDVLYRLDDPSRARREFLKSIEVPVVTKRCDYRATAKKSTADNVFWSLQVGDFVCLANNKANKVAHQDSKRNPWYPYVGPWSFCQVLTIYRDADNSSFSRPLLEVRYLHRLVDLPIHVRTWTPGPRSSNGLEKEEVFETGMIESDIPAARVLGRVDLFLSHFEDMPDKTATANDVAIPTVACRCRYFYDTSLQRLHPLFCASTRPLQWFRRMLERGLKSSQMIKEHKQLGEIIEFCLNIDVGLDTPADGLEGIFQDFIQDNSEPDESSLCVKTKEDGTRCEYMLSTSIAPPWKLYTQSNRVCSEGDRKDLWWTLKVGDIVAIRNTKDSPEEDLECYPYTESWRPCQVLEMYREREIGSNLDDKESLLLQVRWFYRQRELPGKPEPSIIAPSLESLYETDEISVEPLDSSRLLGPITLFYNSKEASATAVWSTVDPFLPVCPFIYGGTYTNGKHRHPRLPSDPRKMLQPLVRRGIEASVIYSNTEKTALLAGLVLDDMDEESEADKENSAWMSVPPFHVDHATATEYFTELSLYTPYSEYATSPPSDSNAVWTVGLGDLVVIRFGKSSIGKVHFPHPMNKGSLNFPMLRPWALGEVVTIMKTCDGTRPHATEENIEDVTLEVRWFYRAGELPGFMRNQSGRSQTEDRCEEVFESDHYQLVHPSSLLAPAVLHPTKRSLLTGREELGMPVLEFCCNQYYSVHGKSNLACGGLDGRIERGRLHSKYFGKDTALKKALDFVRSTASAPATEKAPSTSSVSLSWKDAFNSVITKLSLTDASKEAYESRSALIGREEEKDQIMSFLQAAISGDPTDNKSSIFIAGPPGVGKTASVRATISELQDAQSKGTIPNFDFISLNGMEMRHPFEAYARLWEELDSENSRCSPEAAAAKLEAFFTTKPLDATDKGRVAVVLVDEIDYLVTKKQSVLYNLFDWPIRALECGSKNRLIVLGVSNTLNLPERLHPRVQSRIGSRRCYFKSYSFQQTVAILKAKMKQASPDYSVFDEDAIIFASRKTAALSGDLRKAFHICRAAAEMVMEEADKSGPVQKNPIVRIKDVLKVSRESFNSAQSKAVSLSTSFEALLLVSIAALSKSTGREFGGFDVEEIMTKMEGMANASGDPEYQPAPNLPETLGILSRLGEANLVSLQTPRNSSVSFRASLAGSGGAWPLVTLQLDDIAIMVALKGTPHHDLSQKHLMTNSF